MAQGYSVTLPSDGTSTISDTSNGSSVVRAVLAGLDHQTETLGNIIGELETKLRAVLVPEAEDRQPEAMRSQSSISAPLADDLELILGTLRREVDRLSAITTRITPL